VLDAEDLNLRLLAVMRPHSAAVALEPDCTPIGPRAFTTSGLLIVGLTAAMKRPSEKTRTESATWRALMLAAQPQSRTLSPSICEASMLPGT
jgi:hypothetical protein